MTHSRLKAAEPEHSVAKEAGTGSELDAQILLGAAVGQPREFLYAWPETPVSDQAQRELEANLERAFAANRSPTSQAGANFGRLSLL